MSKSMIVIVCSALKETIAFASPLSLAYSSNIFTKDNFPLFISRILFLYYEYNLLQRTAPITPVTIPETALII